jgi:hypothetical protein
MVTARNAIPVMAQFISHGEMIGDCAPNRSVPDGTNLRHD